MACICVWGVLLKALLGFFLFWVVARIYTICRMGVCRSQKRLDGKVVIVTGGNTGIGKEAAKDLARRGAKVILACRNTQKAEKAAVEIGKACPGCQVTVKKLDLCSIQSMRHFADEIIKEESRLDVLINNAGLAGDGQFSLTEDGFEAIYQSNYLGAFYLTERLLPLLKKSGSSRIVNTGSAAHLLGSISIANFPQDVKTLNTSTMRRYSDTKLAMLMWTRAMAEELRGSDVTINVLHPGVVSSEFMDKGPQNLLFKLGHLFVYAFSRNCVEGAQTIIHLAVADEVQGISGAYWDECSRTLMVRSTDKETNRQLVATTRKLLGLE